MSTELIQRISRFIDNPESESFEALALAAFRFQFEHIPPFRRLCLARGAHPDTVPHWREIPAVPVAAFKSLELHAAPPVEIFRSSGTTGGNRSVHFHAFPDLYRQVIETSFPAFCLPPGDPLHGRPPMLALIPPRSLIDDSSLGFMVDHVLSTFGAEDSTYAFGASGVEPHIARLWCERQIAGNRPVLVLGTSFALVQWIDSLESGGHTLRLPEGSAVFDTGGFKGRSRELSYPELQVSLERHLAIHPRRIVREYGMTELTSQLYTGTLRQGSDLFTGPHWLRFQTLDPLTWAPASAGESGLVAIFDLANVGSAIHLLTQDIGKLEKGELRLLGRAGEAELRGCSLTAEQLAADHMV